MSITTISTHWGGDQCHRDHNIRNPKIAHKLKNVDENLTYMNETLIDTTIKTAYRKLFKKPCEKYNAKQKRKDRQMTPEQYYSKIKNNPNKHLCYECIVGVYNNEISPEKRVEILKQWFYDFKRKNPNMAIFGAYIHCDEPKAGIHLHMDIIPLHKLNKNGLDMQVGLVKALKSQGFENQHTENGLVTAQTQWQQYWNKHLERIVNSYGYEVTRQEDKVQHLETNLYKLNKEYEALKTQYSQLKQDVEIFAENLNKRIFRAKEYVVNKQYDLAQREYSIANEEIAQFAYDEGMDYDEPSLTL